MKLTKIDHHNLIYGAVIAYLLTSILLLLRNNQFGHFLQLDQSLAPIKVAFLWIGCWAFVLVVNRVFKLNDWQEDQLLVALNSYLLLIANQSRSSMIILGCGLISFTCLHLYIVNYHKGYRFAFLVLVLYGLCLLRLIKTHYSQAQLGKFAWEPSLMDGQLFQSFCLVLIGLMIWMILSRYLFSFRPLNRSLPWILLMVSLVHILILYGFMFVRIKTFRAPTFDMGIFTQMFHSMIKGQGPVTTLERDRLLSHFAVHLSPIHYVLWPVFHLFPNGLTLEVSQVIICLSGLGPLYLILKEYGFLSSQRLAFLAAYLWLPTLNSGYFYDYHENCFLAPLILWVFYFLLTDRPIWGVLASGLLLIVKEDAAIYLVTLGLFFLFEKQRKSSRLRLICLQIILPILYFLAAVFWLNQAGEGAMTSRFANFMLANQSGLTDALINAVSQPAYTLTSIMTPSKLTYCLIILASQAGLPLLQRRWHVFILALPLLVINLLSDWIYQVDVFKQYHFGSTTLIFLMSVMAYKELRKSWQPSFIRGMLTMSLTFTLVLFNQKSEWFKDYWLNRSNYQESHQVLAALPKDQPILASYQYTTPLAEADALYDLFYHNQGEVDNSIRYLIYDQSILAESSQDQERQTIHKYQQAGYREMIRTEGGLVVLTSE